jgi:general secretion pathway protein I
LPTLGEYAVADSRRLRGFTLIETLIAFAILSLGLATLTAAFSTSLDYSTRGAEESRAAAIAASILDRVGGDRSVAASNGATDGYDWRISVPPHGTDTDRANWPVSATDVTVTVAWRSYGRDHALSLSTLRLGSPW